MGLLFGLLLGHLGVFHLRLDGILLILRGSHPVDRTAQSAQGLMESVKALPESWLSEIAGHARDSINPRIPSYAPWDVLVEFTEGGEVDLRERGESWEWASANQRGRILSPGGVRVGRPAQCDATEANGGQNSQKRAFTQSVKTTEKLRWMRASKRPEITWIPRAWFLNPTVSWSFSYTWQKGYIISRNGSSS